MDKNNGLVGENQGLQGQFRAATLDVVRVNTTVKLQDNMLLGRERL